MKLDLRNTVENLGLILVTSIIFLVLGVGMGYKVAIKAIESQQEIIIKAIDKNTTEIVNEFDKIKSKKGSQIQLSLDSEATTIIENDSTVVVQKKKGFFKRIFKGKK